MDLIKTTLANPDFLSRYKNGTTRVSGPRTAREAAIEEARELINRDREGTPRPPATFMAVNMKTLHLSLFDLQWHIQECKKADNFSKCFYGKLKIKSKI